MKYIKPFKSNDELKKLFLDNKIDSKFKKLLYSNSEYYKTKSPPIDLENEYYLKGISRNYNIPFNLTVNELEILNHIFMKDEVVTDYIFNKLLKINNNLTIFKNYPFNDTKYKENFYKKGAVIGGVCSSMNINDIKDYLDNHTEIIDGPFDGSRNDYKFKRLDDREIEYNYLYNTLYNKGIFLSYFPSIETMENILNQIKG